MNVQRLLLCLSLLLAPLMAAGDDAITLSPTERVYFAPVNSWQISWSQGYGQLQSPLSDQKSIRLVALPSIRYYGERFYLDNTSMGYSFYESPTVALDLAGRVNTDGIFFPGSGNYLIKGMAARSITWGSDAPVWTDTVLPAEKRLSYMGGLALSGRAAIDYKLAAYSDVSNVHGGQEVLLTLSKIVDLGPMLSMLELGATYKSEALVDYYYGVELSSETEPLLSYHPDAAINWHAKIEANYPLLPNWSLVASGKIEHLDQNIVDSPIVIKGDIASFFIGIRYLWR